MVLFVVNFLTSPPREIISLTNFEEIIWFSTLDIKKIVSTLSFNFLFIPANWNSYSKSDTTLNPGGVRLGTAEIYSVVEKFEEIKESIVIGQSWNNDVRIILFIVLNQGYKLNDTIKDKINKAIRSNASPRHVPSKILSILDIPKTKNGKLVELAVKQTVEGKPIKNLEALANPDSLKQFKNIKELNE